MHSMIIIYHGQHQPLIWGSIRLKRLVPFSEAYIIIIMTVIIHTGPPGSLICCLPRQVQKQALAKFFKLVILVNSVKIAKLNTYSYSGKGRRFKKCGLLSRRLTQLQACCHFCADITICLLYINL